MRGQIERRDSKLAMESRETKDKEQRWLFISSLFCSMLAMLVFVNSLDGGFVYDDTRAIVENGDVRSDRPWWSLLKNDFWGTPIAHTGSHKSFRPLTSATFRLNYMSHGLRPLGYHVVNVVLHATCTALVVKLVHVMSRGEKLEAILAGILFAIHPVHVENVAGIVGRADVLAAIFFILAILNQRVFNKESEDKETDTKTDYYRRLSLTTFLTLLATLSKESGIMALPLCILVELHSTLCLLSKESLSGQSVYRTLSKSSKCSLSPLKRLILMSASTVIVLSTRYALTGCQMPKFASSDNPASRHPDVWVRTLSFVHLPYFHFLLLLRPVTLCFDWSMDSVPLVQSVWDARLLYSTLFYLSMILLVKRSTRTWLPPLLLMLLPFLPASNLLFYVGFVAAERVLYIPSIGFCLMMARAINKLASHLVEKRLRHRDSLALLILALVALPLLCRTMRRNGDWSNEETLYASGVAVNPPKALGNLASVLSQQHRMAEAELALRLAIWHRPNMADAHYNLGVLLQQQRRTREAIQAYELAIQHRPRLLLAHMNLALCRDSLGERSSALQLLSQASLITDQGVRDPRGHAHTHVALLVHQARLLSEHSRPQEALVVLEEAERAAEMFEANFGLMHNQMAVILNLRADALAKSNRSEEAEMYFNRALQRQPDHVPACLMLAKLLAKNKTRISEAERWFERARSLAPSDPDVGLHYGLFLLDTDKPLAAAKQFEMSTQHSSSVSYETVFNAAVAFRLAGDLERSEDFYRLAHSMRSDLTSKLNLGALLHLAGKLDEAEAFYLQAFELNPDHPATATNLRRLRAAIRAREGNRV